MRARARMQWCMTGFLSDGGRTNAQPIRRNVGGFRLVVNAGSRVRRSAMRHLRMVRCARKFRELAQRFAGNVERVDVRTRERGGA
jgi:hypothetical protein